MDSRGVSHALLELHDRLLARYGPQHWWPAKKPFEIIVGAILTQSAAWSNVEKAIANLRSAKALSPKAMRVLPLDRLSTLVYPCGYYNAKALKLKSFAHWLGQHFDDDLDKLFSTNIDYLRQQLLSVHGIGPETADSIILYAANKPTFVIDAYTKRIVGRIGLAPEGDSYHAFQTLFLHNLPTDTRLFNEYHALLVRLGKDVCRSQPLCQQCCVNDICRYYIKEAKL